MHMFHIPRIMGSRREQKAPAKWGHIGSFKGLKGNLGALRSPKHPDLDPFFSPVLQSKAVPRARAIYNRG